MSKTWLTINTLCAAALMAGCVTVGTVPMEDEDHPNLTAEQLAVRDAITRFAKLTKADYLPVAPDRNIVGDLPEVSGCKLEKITRDELVARNKEAKAAPLILAVNVYHHEAGAAPDGAFTVLVALEVAAITGFEEMPDGTGCEYVYRPTKSGVEFVKQQGWVE